MVHPSELLRTDSGAEGSFVAPVVDYMDTAKVDCGCTALPCFAERLNLVKFAKPRAFMAVLSLAGFLNGAILKFFRGTSQVWSIHYNIPQETVDWIIFINEIFVGVFALVVAYWGNKSHRPNWLGALTIYLAISCLTLAVPEIFQPVEKHETDPNNINGNVLCQISTLSNLKNLSTNINEKYVAFAILIIYQMLFAFFAISFVAHGVTYLDDNVPMPESPVYIGLVLSAPRMGRQFGIQSSWSPYTIEPQTVFLSTVWLILSILLFLMGCLIMMFPRVLPNTLLKKSVNSLLRIAAGDPAVEDTSTETDTGFFKSLWRLLRNRILLLNIISAMFIQAAVINFTIKEKDFNQLKYHISKNNDASGYSDPSLIQFTTNLLTQPLTAIAFVTAGMVIAKIQPKPKVLILWNIKVFLVITITFASIRYLSCATKIKNELGHRLTIPYCSWNCGCSLDGAFQPVCLNGGTYFSPCIAGCGAFDSTLKIYQNCTCGDGDKTIAADGSCDRDQCSTSWVLAQTHSVTSAALVASTVMVSLFINIRCVTSRDKALALGLHMTFVSLVPHLPIRALFEAISDNFCHLWGKTTCQFYSNGFAIFLASATIGLKVLGIVFAIILLFFVDKLQLYSNSSSNKGSAADLHQSYQPNHDVMDAVEQLEYEPLIQATNGLARRKQQSDSGLNSLATRTSKEARMNAYLSEGDLVPPLKSNLRLGKSGSKASTSNNSVLSTDSSLSAIANQVGDDHDSDVSTIQKVHRMRFPERSLEDDSDTSVNSHYKERNAQKSDIRETSL